MLPYKRVLLKLSGEALMGSQKFGIEKNAFTHISNSVKQIHDLGVEIGIVVGGGNIFRGNLAENFELARTPADHIGMLATTINGIILQQAFSNVGIETLVMSARSCDSMIETYHWTHALHALAKKKIVIFVGGTGNPYFTTDTAAALRASELKAEVLLKATKVDGVYSDDPQKNPKAVKYETLTYNEALTKNLRVMDATALALCRENTIPIYVFNLFEKGSLLKAVREKKGGSLVSGE